MEKMDVRQVHEWRWRSFEKLLGFTCQSKNPKEVLEWGPGRSTFVILNHALQANILSIEHHAKWYRLAVRQFEKSERVELVHREIGVKGGVSVGYANYPLWRAMKAGSPVAKYDLVFVDGRHRFDCLVAAFYLVKDDGVVMLHDTWREIYMPAVELFPHVKVFDNVRTAVMSKSPLTFLDRFEQGEVPGADLDDKW